MALPLIVVTDTYLHSCIDPERMKGWVGSVLHWRSSCGITDSKLIVHLQKNDEVQEKCQYEEQLTNHVGRTQISRALIYSVMCQSKPRIGLTRHRIANTANLSKLVKCDFYAVFFVNKTFYHACLGGAIGSVAVRPRAAWLRWSASLGRGPGWPDHCVCKYI